MAATVRSIPASHSRRPLAAALRLCTWLGLLTSAPAAADDFTVTPTNLQFGAVYIGATAQIQVYIINISGLPQSPNFSGGAPIDHSNFGAYQSCAGVTLAPGSSCQFNYLFHPATVGNHGTSTSIGIDNLTYPITLAGIGNFPLSIAPLNLDFGSVAVGGSANKTVLITNISGVAQAPDYAGGAPIDQSNFGAYQSCAGVTLQPGGTCQFTYQFHPVSAGPHVSGTTLSIYGQNFGIVLSGFGGSDLVFFNGFD